MNDIRFSRLVLNANVAELTNQLVGMSAQVIKPGYNPSSTDFRNGTLKVVGTSNTLTNAKGEPDETIEQDQSGTSAPLAAPTTNG